MELVSASTGICMVFHSGGRRQGQKPDDKKRRKTLVSDLKELGEEINHTHG